VCDFGHVIVGYDDATDAPPLLGRCAREAKPYMERPHSWPMGLIVLGARTEPMDPVAADAEALRHAVALARDEAGPFEEHWRARRFTGQKAFAAWAALLRDMDEPTEDRHHWNMRLNLTWNRTAAVAYLRGVAASRDGEAAEALREATASYESVLDQLEKMECTGVAGDPEARRRLAEQVEGIASTELEAARHIEAALGAW
jgi:hypothetical protein